MFKYDNNNIHTTVPVVLDGQAVSLPAGMSVAAGLLAIGEIISRISPSSKKPCSPHCLMGVCYECLMEINGVKRQACMTEAEEGMVINRYLHTEKGEDA
ncbi:MAG: (2Fe-2S)-binding protein [Desulfobacteraceae bacterium]|nr:(2Fe-2S)-binding protein [Desulfobacteraceae bacterium]